MIGDRRILYTTALGAHGIHSGFKQPEES